MAKKKYLSRVELLAKIKRAEPQVIDVPGVGGVRMQRVTNSVMGNIHMSATDGFERSMLLILETCCDLTEEDISALQECDSSAFAALASAVDALYTGGKDPEKKL